MNSHDVIDEHSALVLYPHQYLSAVENDVDDEHLFVLLDFNNDVICSPIFGITIHGAFFASNTLASILPVNIFNDNC